MMIAVPFFGDDPRFFKLLAHWFECHARSGTKIPAVVITDELTLRDYPCLAVDTFELRRLVQRGNHPWDRKGAIVLEASRYLGRFLACDLDAFIEYDPAPLMADLPDVMLATTADPGPREIKMHWNKGQPITKQRNAGVMWFGDVKRREELRAIYVREFYRMGGEFEKDEWREQLAWSAVAYQTGMHELPKELNWSHLHPGKEMAAIVHEHGPTKWRRIA